MKFVVVREHYIYGVLCEDYTTIYLTTKSNRRPNLN